MRRVCSLVVSCAREKPCRQPLLDLPVISESTTNSVFPDTPSQKTLLPLVLSFESCKWTKSSLSSPFQADGSMAISLSLPFLPSLPFSLPLLRKNDPSHASFSPDDRYCQSLPPPHPLLFEDSEADELRWGLVAERRSDDPPARSWRFALPPLLPFSSGRIEELTLRAWFVLDSVRDERRRDCSKRHLGS